MVRKLLTGSVDDVLPLSPTWISQYHINHYKNYMLHADGISVFPKLIGMFISLGSDEYFEATYDDILSAIARHNVSLSKSYRILYRRLR